MNKTQQKLELTVIACLFSLANIYLIDSYTIVGMAFGFFAFGLLIKALRLK